jgi:CMP-N-acetylneuraminic acid synthetase
MHRKVVVIPAKGESRRVPQKNWRPFADGMSLTEWKVKAALATDADVVVVSTDDQERGECLRQSRVEIHSRPKELCGDHVDLGRLFTTVLHDYANDVVFWAHPTSPFVRPATIATAMEAAGRAPGTCILGVELRHEFLWTERGPVNYDPQTQPRSQDLAPLFAVTGGVHCAFGRDFIRRGAVSFVPAEFILLGVPESIDIDDMEDWQLGQLVAKHLPQAWSWR